MRTRRVFLVLLVMLATGCVPRTAKSIAVGTLRPWPAGTAEVVDRESMCNSTGDNGPFMFRIVVLRGGGDLFGRIVGHARRRGFVPTAGPGPPYGETFRRDRTRIRVARGADIIPTLRSDGPIAVERTLLNGVDLRDGDVVMRFELLREPGLC